MATPAADTYTPQGPKPVFIQARDVPQRDAQLTGGDVYIALIRSVDRQVVRGVQRIGSLWRIYVNNHDARVRLISHGIVIRNTTIPVYDTNPYTKSANEHLTRITIKDIPLSVSDELLKSTLNRMKYQVRGDVIRQKLRVNGELIDCFNGDRVCYIDPPSQPLPRMIVFANLFRARVFHVGQPERVTTCSRCLENGHHVSQCGNSVKCKNCHKVGHISSACPDSVNTAAPGNAQAGRDSARNPGNRSRDQIAPNNGCTRGARPKTNTTQQKQDDFTANRNVPASSRETDTLDRGNKGDSQHPDTTNEENQRSDDVTVRAKITHQPDISYFLRPKNVTPTGSPGRVSSRDSTRSREDQDQEEDQDSEDAYTHVSDEGYTEEELPVISDTPKQKKKEKKKPSMKRGYHRK